MDRREFLTGSLAAATMLSLPRLALAAGSDVKLALTESNLVYLTPVRSNGALSSCQAEVWYVMIGPDVYICTDASSWRARAIDRGIRSTKLWVGDLGVWRRANYQSLPSAMATASVERDAAMMEAVLDQFGRKYSAEWDTWGPRFRKGLADGSRTMLRYELVG